MRRWHLLSDLLVCGRASNIPPREEKAEGVIYSIRIDSCKTFLQNEFEDHRDFVECGLPPVRIRGHALNVAWLPS